MLLKNQPRYNETVIISRVNGMEKYQFSKQEQEILEGLKQPFAVYQFVDKKVVTLILSDGFCDLFGYDDKQKAYYDMDHDMYKDTHPDDIARIANAALRFAAEDVPYDVVYRTHKKNSTGYYIIHSSGKHVLTDTGVRLAHVWYQNEGEYSEKNEKGEKLLNESLNIALHEESILKASHFDYLTGLPSMTYFFELVEIGRKTMKENGQSPALLFIDLSGMKFYNSKYGFSQGNDLLQDFAKLLSDTFNNENCCHISGDHFLVMTQEEGLEKVLKKLFKDFESKERSLPMRVGVYPASIEDIPASAACDRAKFACDAIRNVYGSYYNYYSQEIGDEAERRQYILSNLDRAIKEKWIKVYYQPIVRAVNGRVCDEEALARWIDPVKGFLSPAYFIPYLEEAGQLYKLDIYMVEQVLEKMKRQKEEGFYVVPHSINFSRSDFEACDIVEEVRKRVDESGIPRDKITIEITESAVGNNFDFMKQQIERFQSLGFPVWMDDFGSGYSSLDVLSSIKFNLIKFDMIFMKKFKEEESRKIVLSELMRMATSLGVATVCEGVETIEQLHFLQEIGCSKLQGFYYSKPISFEQIMDRYEKGIQIGYENPDESDYYEVMGRVNLYDLSAIANEEEHSLRNFFNTLPMGIIEMNDNMVRFVRSNTSYRDFVRRFFNIEMTDEDMDFSISESVSGKNYISFLKLCCKSGGRLVYDEQMPDGSIVHSLARKVATDNISGKTAIAVAVLSVTEPNEGTTYATIARALAADYYNIYYVDIETENFIEYTSTYGVEELAMERHGENFFETARRDTMKRIYEDDRAPFLVGFTKKNVIRQLDEHGSFTMTYRLIDTGEPMYVNMKIMRMLSDTKHIIIGISIIDPQMKEQEKKDIIVREEMAYSRITALSGGYLGLYTVDPETNGYYEYCVSNEIKSFGFERTGNDFFTDGIHNGKKIVYDEDWHIFRDNFKKDKILKDISEKGSFMLNYRILSGGAVKPILLKIVLVTENGIDKLIVGVRLWKERK